MKCTIKYKTSAQIGPEDWEVYTEVRHISKDDTIESIYDKLFSKWSGPINVELHIEQEG